MRGPLGASSKIRAMLSSRMCLLVLLTLATLGCPRQTAVWIEPGSTSSHLVFNVGPKRGHSGLDGLGAFRVDHCPGGRSTGSGGTWLVWANSVTDPVHQIVYGQLPKGFGGSKALPLETGCYTAEISGTGVVQFEIQSDGKVVELPVDTNSQGVHGPIQADSVTAGT
jgi:hypothetical protein